MDDIKKVLAYSTISQLGLMMLALGVGSWVAAVFHLMTHAFFKALLFLAAGSVIHGTHTQDVREMGGLWRKMPWTTGDLGDRRAVAGRHPAARRLLEQGRDPARRPALGAAACSWSPGSWSRRSRPSTWAASRSSPSSSRPGAQSKSEHAHESHWVMTAPLVILATLAVVVGLVGSPLTDYALGKYLGEHVAGEMNFALAAIAVGAALAGIGYAWLMYQRGKANPDWYMRNRSIAHGPQPALLDRRRLHARHRRRRRWRSPACSAASRRR